MIHDGRVKYHDGLGDLMVDIESVSQAPYNYNNGDVDVIAESIHMNGMYRPLYVQASTREIIAGNHTYLACREMGATQVPVVLLEVDDTVAARIMIEDNEAAKRAIADRGQLLTLLDRIHEETGMYLASIQERDVEIMKALEDIPIRHDEFAQWATFSVQLHPRLMAAFMQMTREADTDADRIELLMRLAGWEG